eukprot:551048-Pleurochrysis_carterae.AAC.1
MPWSKRPRACARACESACVCALPMQELLKLHDSVASKGGTLRITRVRQRPRAHSVQIATNASHTSCCVCAQEAGRDPGLLLLHAYSLLHCAELARCEFMHE